MEFFEITTAAIEEEHAIVISALIEASLRQPKLPTQQCDVADLLPFVSALHLLGNLESVLDSVQGESKVELVVAVRGHSKSHLPLVVGFEELGELGVLRLGDLFEVGLSAVEVL